MSIRKYITHIVVLLALAAFSAALPAAEDHAPQPIAKSERCAVCGMYPASYPRWHAQIVFKDGSHSSFDSPAEMFRFLHNMAKYDKQHTMADIGTIYVPSHASGGWLNARAAFYVAGSTAQGPMGADLPAFGSKEEAAGFAKSAGGKVFGFEQVTPEVLNGGGHGGHAY